ncbi:hypothetical protein [Nitrososphaera sp.]|uniref:hypothetical protein n=1 Tax=Nitrososphaera sp. TaxID=1971748 RepID=UPI002EDAD2E7
MSSAKRSWGKSIAIGIGVSVVGLIVVFFVGSMLTSTNSASSSNFMSSLVPTVHRQNFASGTIDVDAGSVRYYAFSAPAGSRDAKVEGSFIASGGARNDIRVVIVDETSFTNWRNGHEVTTYYNSGQLTTANIQTNIPTGVTLYLVFDNTFSIISDKRVNVDVDLEYTQ